MSQEVQRLVFDFRAPSEGLWEDLLTDWVPDALGGYGVEPASDQARGTWIEVADGPRKRRVPLPTMEFRVWASQSVEPSLSSAESQLGPEVFGYRDATTSYRVEHERYRAALRALHGTGIGVHLDVRDFFNSVRPEVLLDAGLIDDATMRTMRRTQQLFGTALLTGTRWSRRIGNIALRPLDDAIRALAPFVRWQDDVIAIASTDGHRRQIVSGARKSLADLGLQLNEEKLGRPPTGPPIAFPDVGRLPPTERRAQLEAVVHSNLASLAQAKRLVRGYAEAKDPMLLTHAVDLTNAAPGLAPRVAMYLAELADAGLEIELVADVLAEAALANDLWVQSRFVAAACHHPALAARLVSMGPKILRPSAPGWAKDLAARCQHAAAVPFRPPSPRVRRALERYDWTGLRPSLPVVKTNL